MRNWQQHAHRFRRASRRRFCMRALKCSIKWPALEPCFAVARARICAMLMTGADDMSTAEASIASGETGRPALRPPALSVACFAASAAAATACSSSRATRRNTDSRFVMESAYVSTPRLASASSAVNSAGSSRAASNGMRNASSEPTSEETIASGTCRCTAAAMTRESAS
jgi:hypothetical protein